jgi:type VI protein secretion system component Hcp
MKRYLHFKTILFCLCITSAVNSKAQQEYTFTTSAANIISAKALIDLPDLSGNINAIIIATPLGNTKTLNPHPTGAWYYSGKWNIFNSDFAPMPVGMTYKVQYFLTPGSNQFLHLVTEQNLGAEGSYIDNPVLNNKPDAQFSIFLNHSPIIRAGSWSNPNESKAAYSASSGKWYITNINGQPILKGCAYNIVVNNGGNINTPKASTVIPGLVVSTSNSNTVTGPVSPMYMTAWADKQKLPGDNSNIKYPDATELHGFNFSVSRPAVARSGTKNYEPITIKISTGVPVTIPFFEAFLKKRDMEFTIDAFTNSTTGRSELNYTIKLSGASIISFRQTSEEKEVTSTNLNRAIKYLDEIKIIFTKIEFIKNNITVEDIL